MLQLRILPYFFLPLILLTLLPFTGHAETKAQKHKSHHPAEASVAETDPAAPTMAVKGKMSTVGKKGGMGKGGMGGPGMKEMMGAMARPKSTELFPTLIKFPELSNEQRTALQRQARVRMDEGVALFQQGVGAFNLALGRDDTQVLQSSSATILEGLTRFRSGLAVETALQEGSATRNTALRWYKKQLNLLPPAEMRSSFQMFGMTPFSLFVCLFSAGIGLTLALTYLFKVRRTSVLLERLTAGEMVSAVPQAAPPIPAVDVPVSTSSSFEPSADKGTEVAGCCSSSSGPIKAGAGLLTKESRSLCRLRVVKIYQETPEVKTFRLVACDGTSIPFSYQPGQFLTILIPKDGKKIKRNYTISSSPTQGYYCEITVKREEQGVGSRYLHDVLQEGDTLEVQPPSGRFTFTGQEAEDVVLIGGGVGVTPMMSIVRAMLDMGWSGELYFIYACRTLDDFIFADELNILRRRNRNLKTFVAVDTLEVEREGYHAGHLSGARLAEWVPDITAKRVQLCGSPPMMKAIRGMLSELGVPETQVHYEMFGPAPEVTPAEGDASPVASAVPANIKFIRSDKSAELQPGETVLAAAERLGVEIDSSCRAGVCGLCMVKLLEGQVEMASEDCLAAADKEQGMILACQAQALSDLVIEA